MRFRETVLLPELWHPLTDARGTAPTLFNWAESQNARIRHAGADPGRLAGQVSWIGREANRFG